MNYSHNESDSGPGSNSLKTVKFHDEERNDTLYSTTEKFSFRARSEMSETDSDLVVRCKGCNAQVYFFQNKCPACENKVSVLKSPKGSSRIWICSFCKFINTSSQFEPCQQCERITSRNTYTNNPSKNITTEFKTRHTTYK